MTNIDVYSELLIEVEPQHEDIVTAVFFEHGVSGIETRDQDSISLTSEVPRFENSLLLIGYFQENQAFEALSPILEDLTAIEIFKIEARQGLPVDWIERFKEHFRPLEIGKKILVIPSWIQPSVTDLKEKVVIRIEPGPAFGTGQHATTALCLSILEDLNNRKELRGKMLDVGSGSSILGIASVMLGCDHAIGVEIDNAARVWARRNIALNNCSKKVTTTHKSIQAVRGHYPTVVANIRTSVIIDILPQLQKLLSTDTKNHLILSGILKSEEETILKACKNQSLRLISTRQQDEWIALLLTT